MNTKTLLQLGIFPKLYQKHAVPLRMPVEFFVHTGKHTAECPLPWTFSLVQRSNSQTGVSNWSNLSHEITLYLLLFSCVAKCLHFPLKKHIYIYMTIYILMTIYI